MPTFSPTVETPLNLFPLTVRNLRGTPGEYASLFYNVLKCFGVRDADIKSSSGSFTCRVFVLIGS